MKTKWVNVAVFTVVLLLCAVLAFWIARSPGIGGRRGLGPAFGFDGGAAYYAPPDGLPVFVETGGIALDLVDPTGLAIKGDRVYVCGDSEVVVYDMIGERLFAFDVDGTPTCLAVGDDGTVYVGLPTHVEVYTPEGAFAEAWGEAHRVGGREARITSLALADDVLYVADSANARIVPYRLDGNPLPHWDGFTLFSGSGFDVAAAPDGTLWVANPGARELRRYSPDGQLRATWGREGRQWSGFSGCCNPVHVAVRSDGSIVTSEKNIIRVKVSSPSGELLAAVAGPAEFERHAEWLDLAVDGSDRVLVLDPTRRRIRIFEGEQ